jgi:hypothetical protein
MFLTAIETGALKSHRLNKGGTSLFSEFCTTHKNPGKQIVNRKKLEALAGVLSCAQRGVYF